MDKIKQSKKLTPQYVLKVKKIKFLVAFITNILIACFSVAGLVWGWFRFKHQGGWFWSWYTYLSVLFCGFTSLMFVIFGSICLYRKQTEQYNFIYILKNIGTAVVMITWLLTLINYFRIDQIGKAGWEPRYSVYEKSNFILHLVVPNLAILTNLLCERTIKMKFYETTYGISTALIYSAHYLAVGYTHLGPDGQVIKGPEYDSDRFDRYGIFKMFGPKGAWVLIIALSAVTFLFCWLCWLGNRKIHICEEAAPKILGKKKQAVNAKPKRISK